MSQVIAGPLQTEFESTEAALDTGVLIVLANNILEHAKTMPEGDIPEDSDFGKWGITFISIWVCFLFIFIASLLAKIVQNAYMKVLEGKPPIKEAKKVLDNAIAAFESHGREAWLSWGSILLPKLAQEVEKRKREVERKEEAHRARKVMTASGTMVRNDEREGNDDDNNNNNNDEEEEDDEDDDDDAMQKAASTTMSPKAARKVVATKPLPKVVEGSSKVTLVSFRVYHPELIHIFVVRPLPDIQEGSGVLRAAWRSEMRKVHEGRTWMLLGRHLKGWKDERSEGERGSDRRGSRGRAIAPEM